MTEKATLSTNQAPALAVLLTEKTVRDAAKKCGLSEKTLYKYLAEDPFRQALQAANGAIYAEVSNRLTADILKALEKLWAIVDTATDQNIKRMAINDWLKHALKIREVDDLESRIQALEERIK